MQAIDSSLRGGSNLNADLHAIASDSSVEYVHVTTLLDNEADS
jgi:hypothetical protein